MAFAIEMYFDDAADAAVRTVWSALEHREVVSAASGPVQNARPHVSLAVFDDGEMQAVEQILLDRLPAVRRLPLTLASLGFFLTQEAVAFLGVVPTARLLKLHRQVAEAIAPVTIGFRPYYLPDAMTFHCTIASGVRHHARVVSAVATAGLPISATVEHVGVIEVPSGRMLCDLDAR